MKQNLIAIKDFLIKIISKINYYVYCFKGMCPSSNEIKNSEVRNLADRLKANSYGETLTNVLEWQERNIMYWIERHILSLLLYILFTIFLVLSLVIIKFHVLIHFFQISTILEFSIMVIGDMLITTFIITIFILHFNRKISWKEIPRGLKTCYRPVFL